MPFPWPGTVLWSSTATRTLSAAALSALLLASAMKHFRDPDFYGPVVPDYLCRDDATAPAGSPPGSPPGNVSSRKPASARPLAVMARREWIALSGLVEAGAAVGLLIPATRQTTATGVAALFGLFVAGHVDSLRRAYGSDGSPTQRVVHTARLPLQVPLILWAWSLRAGRRTGS
jgi:uncharacterized membrane protein